MEFIAFIIGTALMVYGGVTDSIVPLVCGTSIMTALITLGFVSRFILKLVSDILTSVSEGMEELNKK